MKAIKVTFPTKEWKYSFSVLGLTVIITEEDIKKIALGRNFKLLKTEEHTYVISGSSENMKKTFDEEFVKNLKNIGLKIKIVG